MSVLQAEAISGVWSRHDRQALAIVFTLLVGIILTMRLGYVPGETPLPVCLVLVPAVVWLSVILGIARFDAVALVFYLGVIVVGSINIFFFPENSSLTSFFLLVVLYSPFVLFFPVRPQTFAIFNNWCVKVATVLAALGVMQFLLQFIIPNSELLFSWRFFMPRVFLVEFNSLNYLWWGASTLKANGFFFLESAMFGIFIARYLALAVASGGKWLSCGIMACALLLSYSATAWMTFAVFLMFHFVNVRNAREISERLGLAILGVIGIIVVFMLSEPLHLDRYFDRVTELTENNPGSSGAQRFNIPIQNTIGFLYAADTRQILIGNGPGSVESFMHVGGTFGNAPTWSKQTIEYGFLGLLMFSFLITRAVLRAQFYIPIVIMLLLEMLVISPGMLVPANVSIMYLAFCALTPTRSEASLRPAFPLRGRRAAISAAGHSEKRSRSDRHSAC
ncbi:MAG: hypothetical protein ACFB6R_05465 [Alphaproteobacteria bacterium]